MIIACQNTCKTCVHHLFQYIPLHPHYFISVMVKVTHCDRPLTLLVVPKGRNVHFLDKKSTYNLFILLSISRLHSKYSVINIERNKWMSSQVLVRTQLVVYYDHYFITLSIFSRVPF